MSHASPAHVVPSPARGRHLPLLLLSVALMACGQPSSTPVVAAPGPVQLEAENGTISPLAPQDVAEPRSGGKIIRDQGASGAQAVILLSTHDAVKFRLPGNFTSGRYTVKVLGRGEEYQGWPTVALENDRRHRMSVTTLDTKTYALRGFGEFDLRPNQEMYFTFLNDRYDGPGKDRNAVVDYLLIEPVRKTPPPSRAASFISQFGTNTFDDVYDVAVDGGGNSYLVGNLGLEGNFLRKINPQGKEVWTRRFDSRTRTLRSVVVDRAGEVYVTGNVGGGPEWQPEAGNAYVRRYTPDGNEVWTRQFGGPRVGVTPTRIRADASGNLYVVGTASGVLPGAQGYDGSATNPNFPAFVLRYGPDGTPGWIRQFAAVGPAPSGGLGTFSSPEDAGVDAAGNVYIVGGTTAPFPGQRQVGQYDTFVRKYTPDGAPAWTRQFGSNGWLTRGQGIAVDVGGNSYVVGATAGTLPGPDNAGSGGNFLMRLGPDGQTVWTRQFGTPSPESEAFTRVAVQGSGDVFVAGATTGIFPGQRTAGKEDLVVLKYGADGRALAARQLGTAGQDQVQGLAVDADGVYLAGQTYGAFPGFTSAGWTDALLIKLGASLAAVTPPPTINQPPVLTFKIDNGRLGKSASRSLYAESRQYFEPDHNITLDATASDVDGSIARVEFYVGSRKLGEDTTAPYSLAVSSEHYIEDAPRDYSFSAKAIDNGGAEVTRTAGTIENNSSFASPDLTGIDFGGTTSPYLNFTLFGPGSAGGFTTNGTPSVLDAGRPLVPPVQDPAREALIRSSLSRRGPLELNVPVHNASYAVYLWVRAEDATPYTIRMEGQDVSRFDPKEAGRWDRLGPFEVKVQDGTLSVASTGTVTAHFSAIEYARLPQPGDIAPVVKFKGNLDIRNPPVDGRLSVDASDADGKVVKVEFFTRYAFGTVRDPLTKIGEATQAPYTVVWKNPPSDYQRVTAVATDDQGVKGYASVETSPPPNTAP